MNLPPITAHRSPGTSSASKIEKATIDVKKEVRGGMAASIGGKIPGPYSLGFGGYTA